MKISLCFNGFLILNGYLDKVLQIQFLFQKVGNTVVISLFKLFQKIMIQAKVVDIVEIYYMHPIVLSNCLQSVHTHVIFLWMYNNDSYSAADPFSAKEGTKHKQLVILEILGIKFIFAVLIIFWLKFSLKWHMLRSNVHVIIF